MESEFKNGKWEYTFNSGLILISDPKTSSGTVKIPAKKEVGSFSFPIKYSGDVFHHLKNGGNVLNLPKHCKYW